MYQYSGIIHIHSTYSDGSKSIKEIAKDARNEGIKWIIITDHNSLKGYTNKEEGWYDGVAVIIGEEISPSDCDHYLALNIKEEISENTSAETYINEVNHQNGFGFIAHPDESSIRKNSFRALRWKNWDIKGFSGLEIWNYMSDWTDNMNSKTIFLDYLLRSKKLTGPTEKVLNWWDRLNNATDEIVPAIGGADAHSFFYNVLCLKINVFNYIDCFRHVNNLIYLNDKLSESFDEAKIQILNAIKSGHNTIINKKIISNKKMPECYILDKNKQVYPGFCLNNNENIKLFINLPKNAIIKIRYNGSIIKEIYAKNFEYSNLKSGKYRIEAYVNNIPWFFTNPILIK